MLTASALLAIGLLLLFVGGEALIRGATGIALLARVSTAVVGLTVVAMGTSFPELAVSIGAALRGSTDISYSNVVGSTIFNTAAVLGIAALIRQVPVARQVIRIEYPFMFLVLWIGLLLARDGLIDRLEGAFFVVSLATFTLYMVRLARKEVAGDEARRLDLEVRRAAHVGKGHSQRVWGRNLAFLALGIAFAGLGAHLAVEGAVAMALRFGITERVVGLTIVAMGTSLPEMAASIAAARRNDLGLALGNVVGSNIFNILGILGVTALLVPVPVAPESIALDNWVMLGIAAGLFPVLLLGRVVNRWHGLALLAVFTTYMTFVVRGATG